MVAVGNVIGHAVTNALNHRDTKSSVSPRFRIVVTADTTSVINPDSNPPNTIGRNRGGMRHDGGDAAFIVRP
jgi:hypothetical protein